MMPVRTYSTPPIRAAIPPHRMRFEEDTGFLLDRTFPCGGIVPPEEARRLPQTYSPRIREYLFSETPGGWSYPDGTGAEQRKAR
jgi:hypothetical protein